MKQRRVTWILGTMVTASLLMSAPADAARKSGKGIVAAKRYQVTQITDRDVVLARNTSVKVGRIARLPVFENGRQILMPNPDAQRQILVPNPDAQRQILVPNPDAQ